MKKRKLFDELSEGVVALADRRNGKKTLPTHAATLRDAPTLSPDALNALREKMNLSRKVSD